MPSSRIHFEEVMGSTVTDKRLEVLRFIHQAGSISEAARAAGISYKAAWQALETLGNLAGVPVVEKAVGGSGGGGARLTPEGLQVLQAAEALNAARDQVLARIRRQPRASRLNVAGLAGVGLRTSMRNQMPCVVREVSRVRGSARVVLQLSDGQGLASRITLESLQLLGLGPGRHVLAMFKATAVTVAPRIVAVGGVNLLQGRVTRRGSGAAGLEVSLQVAPGLAVVGFADPDGPPRLRQPAMAAVEETAVVIGLAG